MKAVCIVIVRMKIRVNFSPNYSYFRRIDDIIVLGYPGELLSVKYVINLK